MSDFEEPHINPYQTASNLFRAFSVIFNDEEHYNLFLGITYAAWAIIHIISMITIYNPLIDPYESCFNGTYLRSPEQLVCTPDRQTTARVYRQFPDKVGAYVVKNDSFPEMFLFVKSDSFCEVVQKEYVIFSFSVLKGSQISFNCRDDSNSSWFFFNYFNSNHYMNKEKYTAIQKSDGTGEFKGSHSLSEPGEYDIVVEGSPKHSILVEWEVNITYKDYDLSGLKQDVSCNKTKCAYKVLKGESLILESIGGISEVEASFALGFDYGTCAVHVFIVIAMISFSMYGFCSFRLQRRINSENEEQEQSFIKEIRKESEPEHEEDDSVQDSALTLRRHSSESEWLLAGRRR